MFPQHQRRPLRHRPRSNKRWLSLPLTGNEIVVPFGCNILPLGGFTQAVRVPCHENRFYLRYANRLVGIIDKFARSRQLGKL